MSRIEELNDANIRVVYNDAGDIESLIDNKGRALNIPLVSKDVTGMVSFNDTEVAGYSAVPFAYNANAYVAWQNGTTGRAGGYKSAFVKISDSDQIRVTASVTGGVCALAVYFDNAGTKIGYQLPGADGRLDEHTKQALTIPEGAAFFAITQPDWAPDAVVEIRRAPSLVTLDDVLSSVESSSPTYWRGKKIVWFGTSIPAGGGMGSYPQKVCDALGANLVNEAVATSMARNGVAASRSGPDPYGWAGISWPNVLFSLSATLVEKQYLIDNWATVRATLADGPPATLTPEQQALILDCSWENKLSRHLGSNRADLYVFDHGHNDNLVGITGGGPDVTVADQRDRGTFAGAVAYLVDKILADNPKARICFIGHYENKVSFKVPISTAQKAIAEYWSFPLLPLWEKLGWTQQSITSGGVTKTMTQWMMPDDLHPHSDTTGYAIGKIADVITPFVRDLR